MTRNMFIKISLFIFIILILINISVYNFLNENISLFLSFKASGEVRSDVSKLTGLLFIPFIILFTTIVGLFQEIENKLKHITYLNIFLFLINLIILIFNLFINHIP